MLSYPEMRRHVPKILMLCLLVVLSGSARAVCERPMSIGWEPFEPYMYEDASGKLTGLDIELVSAIMSRMNCSLTFKKLPFKRHMAEIASGETDLASSVQPNPERAAYGIFSKPYIAVTMSLIVRTGESDKYALNALADLGKGTFKLGITRGYFYGDTFQQLMESGAFKSHVDEVVSDEQNLKKLLAGRLDGILADPVVIASLAKSQNAVGKWEIHPLPIQSSMFVIMGSQRTVTAPFMDALNNALEAMKQDGSYQAILDRYLPKGSP